MGQAVGANLPWSVNEGDPSDLRRGRYVLMDRSAERRFGKFEVGEYREILGRRFRIIGTTNQAASFTTAPVVFMDLRQAQELARNAHGKTSYVLVKLAPGADAARVAEAIQVAPHNDVYTRAEWAARSRSYWVVSTGLGMNMGVTVFLGVLVGLVVVAQTLYTSAVEHVKEFGTVKAIGGSNLDIYRILGVQVAVAAVVGSLLGGALSAALGAPMARIGLKLIIPAPLGAAVFAGTLVFCHAAAFVSLFLRGGGPSHAAHSR